MDKETLEKFIKAGKIAAEALAYGEQLIKPGVKLVDVLDKVEEKIISLGGDIAFPAQTSLNDVAAHDCAPFDDERVYEDHVVKLDVGVHIDGCIADTAVTVDLSGKHTDLIKASKEAVENALKMIRPGMRVSEIGKVIGETIADHGFVPVKNLSGHGLGYYKIHTSPTIPNFDTGSDVIIEDEEVIAIEPFASNGAGLVYDTKPANVFTLTKSVSVRDPITRNVLKEIETYDGLPFARRWLERKFGKAKTAFALRNLSRLHALAEHGPLVDKNHGLVSQHEHTVIVLEEGNIVTTKQSN